MFVVLVFDLCVLLVKLFVCVCDVFVSVMMGDDE